MRAATAEIRPDRSIGIRERISAFVELTKPRIALMLVLTSAAGFYLGSQGSLNIPLFINSMIGIALLAFGVATLNQYIERRTDTLMKRTENRPLPSGRVSPAEALIFGLAQCLISEIYLFYLVNPLTALLGLVVIVGYVLLYTPLKTKTSVSTAIGAIPGAIPPLIGWTAAANEITIGGWALFAMLFLWQFPHFFAIAWMYRDDYAKAGIKMLPVLEPDGRITARQIVMFALMLAPVSLAPFFLGFAGPIFLVGATLLALWFVVESYRTARARTPLMARRLLLCSVLYLPMVLGLAVVDSR